MTAVILPLMRPERLPSIIENLAATTEGYRLVVVASGECARAVPGHVDLIADQGGTFAQRINLGVAATSEPLIFMAADDVRFHPGWLEHAKAAMPAEGGVVVVNDLHNPRGTLALVDRRYVELGTVDEPGRLLHEGYGHNYVDNELFQTARSRGRYAEAPESVVEHLHPHAGKGKQDAVYAQGIRSLDADRTLFEKRRHLWA